MEKKVWIVEVVAFVREDVKPIVEELKSKGFDVEVREVIFDLE